MPGLICNIVVKADLGRSVWQIYPHCPILTSTGQEWQLADLPWHISPQMHHRIYIMVMYLAAVLDSSRKVWNLLLFLYNEGQ